VDGGARDTRFTRPRRHQERTDGLRRERAQFGIHTIEVSFEALKDKSERDFLNQLPTSLVLSDDAVDRLRAAAARIVLDSPDLREALNDKRPRVVDTQTVRAQPTAK